VGQNSFLQTIKTIYLIRHGQTDFNQKGIVQGSGIDSLLNAVGHRQAELFFDSYKEVPFAQIYTSTLQRTHQTVAPFINYLKQEHVSMPEFDEINWGVMEGVEPNEESSRNFSEMLKTWRSGNLETAVEKGETPLQLFNRQKNGLLKLESTWPGSPVLICMHGRAMRSFLCLLTGHPLHLMDDFEHSNVCLYKLEKTASELHYRVVVNNCTMHLQNL
jgi:probable phosphoglycerate mutase